jgi:hypothetical protein
MRAPTSVLLLRCWAAALAKSEALNAELGRLDLNSPLPAEIQKAVLASVTALRLKRGVNLSNYAFCDLHGARHQYRLLTKSNGTVGQAADLLQKLQLSLAEVLCRPPAPWSGWPPGREVVLAVGSFPAAHRARGPKHPVVEKHDLLAAKVISDHLQSLALPAPIRTLVWESQNNADEYVKSFLRPRPRKPSPAGLIVIGSSHANELFAPAFRALVKENGSTIRLEWGEDGEPDRVMMGNESTGERRGGQDAGVLLFHVSGDNLAFKLLGIVAGLGEIGTLAAADAVTCGHEVAECMEDGTSLCEAVDVRRDRRDRWHWRWSWEPGTPTRSLRLA